MTPVEFLAWVRGPMFQIAVAIFALGVAIRIVEIFVLGRKQDLSEPRRDGVVPGIKTIFGRSIPDTGTFKRSPLNVVAGYIFHIGLFTTILFFVPHIELFHSVLGLQWPGLPTPFIDAVTVVTIFAMVVILINRLRNPVLKFLSTFEDYLCWLVTLLPLLTGYLAFHRMLFPYQTMLGIHILSVEILLIVFPFTKLMHFFTVFLARWYNGSAFGRRGVQS
ncbi:MAG: hypothetical protein QNI91_10140 [Arenicellales bacterium]|nr:hypothetical protein [Arenicellales bacterium]